MVKTKLLRGRRMLSSILIVIALYYSAPNIFSHDRLSANRLLSWLLLYQIFIFFSSAITISLLVRFLSMRYSRKVSNYILSLCWNDVLAVFSSVSVLHTAFMLASVNVVDYSSQWIVKGINFDIVISFANILVITLYFYIFYTITQPKKLFRKMLKDLDSFLKAGEKERVNEQLLLIKEFFRKANLFLDLELLLSILNSPKAFQLFIEGEKKNDGYLEEIVEILFKNMESAISSERAEKFKEAVDFLDSFVDKVQDTTIYIFEKLITGYYSFIFHNIQRLKYEQVLYIVNHLERIFETLLKKQINISDKSKSDLIGILDRLSYIIFHENSAKSSELLSILEFYIILFAFFEKDHIFYSQVKEEFDTFVIYLLKSTHEFPKKEAKEYILKIIEKPKRYKISFTRMVFVYIFLLTLEYKRYDIGYILFNGIMELVKTGEFSVRGTHTFYHSADTAKKMFYLYKCLATMKSGIKSEKYKKKMYKKYMVATGNCKLKKLSQYVRFKRLSGRK
ncbi:hypothetical protein ELD05_05575 [Caldicellulosiruptor changbaiensis]|uniref:Uncharacterized protein n=1 Tax=Caldicellulosiruptor changbaiensis TaxID=1222016 RepID=A0A3T0D523_9FIRM|nr:hypothetical protein [Caldicellulosiruptor changbaiensis]AZT90156.1 hypothetical protein ELD05_05575 [Caldicellulosiruptor changbaiensis]